MIGAALLGAGSIGSIHARNLRDHPRFRLRHIIDVDGNRAAALCRRYGGEPGDDAEAAVADPSVDAVIIGSSTTAHRDHVLLAARHRRALLCEKPIAASLDDAMACVDAVEEAGIVAAMGFNRRLDPGYSDLHKRVAAGAIGDVEMMRLVSRSDNPPPPESVVQSGGMIREKGVHFYDLACWVADSDPVAVSAAGSCLIDPAYGDHGDVDTAILTLRLANDALVGFDFGRRTAYGCDELIEVFGSRGLLVAERQPAAGARGFVDGQASGPALNTSWREQFAQTYPAELDAFAAAIGGESDVHSGLRDGLRAQAVAEAAVGSLSRNAMVKIEPVWR